MSGTAGAEDGRAAGDEPEHPLPPARLTHALLVFLTLVFLGEMLFPAGRREDWFSPSVQTLIGWGGMSRPLVLDKGEWFRLLTAAFLHGGPIHLLMNGFALLIAGSALEALIGRLWLAALFLLGALGGGLASVHLNDANIVGVGASGAIMALFGFFLTIAFRFEKGPVRRAFLGNSLGALIPSLLPGLIPASGLQIDYAAHAGGAALGALVGLVFLLIWRPDSRYPPGRWFAAVIVLAAAGLVASGLPRLASGFAEARFIGSLMPDSEVPKTDDAARHRADEIIRLYPEDPRGHFYKALVRSAANDAAGTATEIARAVELAERYPGIFLEQFRMTLRAVQALALRDLRREAEARAAAAPVCLSRQAKADLVSQLRRAGLCR